MAEHQGGCRCGAVRYRVFADQLPLTYACHCLDCQTWSGSAFSQNALVDEEVFSLVGTVGRFDLPSADGERISHQFACPRCFTRIYNTNTARPGRVVIRAGTFDHSHNLQIVAHIWTSRTQIGLALAPPLHTWPEGAPADEFYALLGLRPTQ